MRAWDCGGKCVSIIVSLLTHTAKKSFYRYALFLSVVNVVQAIGSFLWYFGRESPRGGNAGIW